MTRQFNSEEEHTGRVESSERLSSPGLSGGAAAASPVNAPKSASRWRQKIEACLPAIVAAWLIGMSLMAAHSWAGYSTFTA